MANEELVARLKGSVDEWNLWRTQNAVPLCDLRGADLIGADLRGADLIGADLRGVDLSFANLRGANLAKADLSGDHGTSLDGVNLFRADLSGANLSGANLDGVRLSEACLSGAHLRGTDLSFANLRGADLSGSDLSNTYLFRAGLSGANLSGANLFRADLSFADLGEANFTKSRFSHTLFAEVDLSIAQGLETAEHRGPSTVNINSVILPQDEPTRTHFLRGVGFTEHQIDYLPSLLVDRPIQYYSLFISYAHEDEALANVLSTHLRKKNVPCWFAPHDLQPGNYYRKHIDQAIHTQEKVLLLLSEHSIKSGWVEHEVEVALRREISQKREILFPLRLDDAIFSCTTSWAESLKDMRHVGDFTSWQDEQRYQEAFALLLRHLKTEPSPPQTLS